MAENSKEQDILKLLITAQEVQECLREANRVFIPSYMRRQENHSDQSYQAAFDKLHSKLLQLTKHSETLHLFESECRAIKARVDAEDAGVIKANEIWNLDKRIDVAQIRARKTLREMAAQYTNMGKEIDAICSDINQTELGQKISAPNTPWDKKAAFYVQSSVLKQALDSTRSALSTYSSMNPQTKNSTELADSLKKTEACLNSFNERFKGDKDLAPLFDRVNRSAQESLAEFRDLKLDIDGPHDRGTFQARHSHFDDNKTLEGCLKSLRSELIEP